jgi:hypothetical protein
MKNCSTDQIIFLAFAVIAGSIYSAFSRADLRESDLSNKHRIYILERTIAEANAEAKEAYFQKWSKLRKEAEEKTGIK